MRTHMDVSRGYRPRLATVKMSGAATAGAYGRGRCAPGSYLAGPRRGAEPPRWQFQQAQTGHCRGPSGPADGQPGGPVLHREISGPAKLSGIGRYPRRMGYPGDEGAAPPESRPGARPRHGSPWAEPAAGNDPVQSAGIPGSFAGYPGDPDYGDPAPATRRHRRGSDRARSVASDAAPALGQPGCPAAGPAASQAPCPRPRDNQATDTSARWRPRKRMARGGDGRAADRPAADGRWLDADRGTGTTSGGWPRSGTGQTTDRGGWPQTRTGTSTGQADRPAGWPGTDTTGPGSSGGQATAPGGRARSLAATAVAGATPGGRPPNPRRRAPGPGGPGQTGGTTGRWPTTRSPLAAAGRSTNTGITVGRLWMAPARIPGPQPAGPGWPGAGAGTVASQPAAPQCRTPGRQPPAPPVPRSPSRGSHAAPQRPAGDDGGLGAWSPAASPATGARSRAGDAVLAGGPRRRAGLAGAGVVARPVTGTGRGTAPPASSGTATARHPPAGPGT